MSLWYAWWKKYIFNHFQAFLSLSTMPMHAQACVCWSKYTTVIWPNQVWKTNAIAFVCFLSLSIYPPLSLSHTHTHIHTHTLSHLSQLFLPLSSFLPSLCFFFNIFLFNLFCSGEKLSGGGNPLTQGRKSSRSHFLDTKFFPGKCGKFSHPEHSRPATSRPI